MSRIQWKMNSEKRKIGNKCCSIEIDYMGSYYASVQKNKKSCREAGFFGYKMAYCSCQKYFKHHLTL